MKIHRGLLNFLVVAALSAVLPDAWTSQAHAQGGPPGTPQMSPGAGAHQQQVQGAVKDLDRAGRMLTLEDGTQLTIPPTVQLPGEIREGSIVKASFEEQGGQKVVTSLEVQIP
jgi:hypothetical protein